MQRFVLLVGAAAAFGFGLIWSLAPYVHDRLTTSSASADPMRYPIVSSKTEIAAAKKRDLKITADAFLVPIRDRAAAAVRKPDGYCSFEFSGEPDLRSTCISMQRKAAAKIRNFYDGVIRDPDASIMAVSIVGLRCEKDFTRAGMTDWSLTKACLMQALKESELSLMESIGR